MGSNQCEQRQAGSICWARWQSESSEVEDKNTGKVGRDQGGEEILTPSRGFCLFDFRVKKESLSSWSRVRGDPAQPGLWRLSGAWLGSREASEEATLSGEIMRA